ncbi:MAG: hypothetical protein ACPGSL_03295 [Vicingaceae bacterium]
MDSTTLLLLFLLDVVVAFLIAKYQQNNGYTFYKSFFGALIGVIGLTLLGIKGWNAL